MSPTLRYRCLLAGILLLFPLLGLACAPGISREMLTPTATFTITPLPTRTPDPNSTATRTLAPTRTPSVTPTPESDPSNPLTPEVTTARGLLIEAYPLGPADGYTLQPEDFIENQDFYERIPPSIFSRRADLWQASQALPLELLNPQLEPFGIRLARSTDDPSLYNLYKDNQLLQNKVTNYGALQVNRTGTDFILPVTIDNAEVWILQRESFVLWFAGRPRFIPIFAGDAVLTSLSEPVQSAESGGSEVLVMQEEQPVYSLPISSVGAEGCPVESFRGWNDAWVLESEGDVVIDGERLSERHGFDQIFNWQALGGKEFFLFEENNRFGIFYDGRDLPMQYDEIVRWPCVDQLGGSGYNFSARGTDMIAGFFARKDGDWYYVEVTPTQ